jgi:hypothetical protein
MSRALASLGVAFLLLAGCRDGGSPAEPQGSPRPLPASFRLLGSASAVEADGTSISCALDLVFELAGNPRETPGALEYEGTYGGGIRRTIFNAAGNGLSLEPDVYGQVIARSLAPNRIQITIPLNAGAESRFWRELAQFQGTFDSGEVATGNWNCAPFDIDSGGRTDTQYTARGSWTLLPITAAPMKLPQERGIRARTQRTARTARTETSAVLCVLDVLADLAFPDRCPPSSSWRVYARMAFL